jgi:hypothetical protein
MTPNVMPAPSTNGDRRVWVNRRRFYYTVHIPERRSFQDRRSGVDRRIETGSSSGVERRATSK